jgi:hypothetical protein
MSVKQITVRLRGLSGLPEDVYENVLFFEQGLPDTLEGDCDQIAAAYDALSFTGGWNQIEIRCYELGGGQPIFQKTYAISSASTLTGPGEVAVCLSYAANDDPGLVGPRRRGRIYIGPIAYNWVQDPRPGLTLRQNLLAFGQALAAVGTASNTTWVMYSRTDLVTAKIESIWVDDAWDTQRRRGLAPTVRDVQDVQ